MKDELRPTSKHQYEHVVPTVIHQPDEDRPLLASWLDRAMENPTRFWTLVGGSCLAILALVILANGISLGRSTEVQAWTRLETAKTPAERVEIAREYPKTPAEQWALLQAASEYYNQGFADLPANRDVALPALKKALDYFEEVAREAPADSPQARAAAFGAARTLEARNELKKAIAQYEKVAKAWPDSDEAKQSERLAKELTRPEAAEFYEKLYAFKPTEVSLPPMGTDALELPPGHPPVTAPATSGPSPLLLPPPPAPPKPSSAEAPTPRPVPSLPGLPAEVFAPGGSAPGPKPEMPRPEAPQPEPDGAKPEAPQPKPEAPPQPKPAEPRPERPKSDLPDDVFSPR